MYRIIKAESKSELKAFFDLSISCGYTKGEAAYIKKHFAKLGDRAIYLMALYGETPCARLLTWTDAKPAGANAGIRGFFALIDGEAKALDELIRYMETLQAEMGAKELFGPVPPDGSGFFVGQCEEAISSEMRGAFTGAGDMGQTGILLSRSYKPLHTQFAFQIETPKINPYRESAERFGARTGLRAVKAQNGFFNQNLLTAIGETSSHCEAELKQALKLMQHIDLSHSFIVTDKAGIATGYAISLKGEPMPRVCTIATKAGEYRRVTALLLVSALVDSYMSSGENIVELSVIDSDNAASLALVNGVNARFNRKYIVYNKQLT